MTLSLTIWKICKLRTAKSLMLRSVIFLHLFLCVVCFKPLVVWADSSGAQAQQLEKAFLKVTGKEGSSVLLHVEIADDMQERAIGMMYRQDVPQNTGMLFVFEDNTERFFWMKNTFVSLDILFLDKRGRIHHIHKNAVPESLERIPSRGKSVGVLEVGAGEAERLGIQVGDYIEYSDFFMTE